MRRLCRKCTKSGIWTGRYQLMISDDLSSARIDFPMTRVSTLSAIFFWRKGQLSIGSQAAISTSSGATLRPRVEAFEGDL